MEKHWILVYSFELAMANRVYIRNLTFSVDKWVLLRAVNLWGVPAISVDDIQVVRKTDPFWSTNRECSAFLTYDTEEQVERAIRALNGKLLDSCSWRPVVAEKAIPRMNTLVGQDLSKGQPTEQNNVTTDIYFTDLSQGSSGAAAVAYLMEAKKEQAEQRNQADLQESSAGAAAVSHLIEAKKEEAAYRNQEGIEIIEADLQESSSGAAAVAHMMQVKKEQEASRKQAAERSKRKTPSNERPWDRRQRLRQYQ